ncbi:unnamed protein product [Phytophthora fragariaefolia]|uniref:Unnamed protein product n=1 Tax=Phytophthora fragariaefolia TaxID=1490495 RepID=A0A9W7D8V9_9STRA|nr:unnamed protein product [Phytophthora fragariaefolia]
MPKPRTEEHLLLAPTLVKVCNGSIRVPVLSLAGRTTKLPSRETLGTWLPSNEEMEVLETTGELDREQVKGWLASIRRAQAEPLSNEKVLELGDMGDEDKELMLNLLRCPAGPSFLDDVPNILPRVRPEFSTLPPGTSYTPAREGEDQPVLSLAGRTTKLPSRETLGTWLPSNEEMEVLETTGELDREQVKGWLASIRRAQAEPLSNEKVLELGDMGDEDKELMLNLLRWYPALLEPRKGCPPATTLDIEHEIHTGNEAPIKVRALRHAQLEHEVIDKALDEMLDGGVVEEGHGARGFPVVLVKKKDGSADSSLDIHTGYWQVPVAAKDRDKTAFVTRRVLFQFVRMPFGFANAPGTFQRMMDTILRGMAWLCCLVYLDDVNIFTKGDVARPVVELATVLEILSRAGLSLKASKCSFGTTRLEYLRHELDTLSVMGHTHNS